MAKTVFKLTRKPIDSKFAGRVMNNAIRSRVRRDAFPTLLARFGEKVENWKDKPTFTPFIHIRESGLEFGLKVEEDLAGARWLMVDSIGRAGGTLIQSNKMVGNPPRPKRLRIRLYDAKTPGGKGYTDDEYYTMAVTQGAVEPRHYSDEIIRGIAGDTDRIVPNSILWNAIRLGYRQAARQLSRNPNF